MNNERIDLKHLEEDALMEDLNWSIARFEQVEKLVKNMIAELKRCYAFEDELAYLWHVAHGHNCGWCNDAEEDISDLCKNDYRCFLREHFASE